MDHHDTLCLGGVDIFEGLCLAFEIHLPAGRGQIAAQDLYGGGLASAIFADQCVNFTRS